MSTIDLGLPSEAQVLAQFFDQDFIPSDYINALFMTSLNASAPTTNMLNNKSLELNSASSLKILFKRCSALSLHFNEYTNEIVKRFDQSYEKLHASASQIISYDGQNQLGLSLKSLDDNDTTESKEIITRLQYHLATLNTSMYSLLDELKQTREKLDTIDPNKTDQNSVDDLQMLVLVKKRVEEVKTSFNLLKSLVASSEIEVSTGDLKNAATFKSDKITVAEFKNALAVLCKLMQEQLSQEIDMYTNSKKDGHPIEVNEKLMKIIDNMINLQPLFKSFLNFQSSYAAFVEFLKEQKNNYLNLFD
ncbi:hypothetical protein PMKS-000627 [Pichia membranifaciens]|uniref:Uncharacterized protein n=1 Tax=Pichia membranifaciens TaxID=4926 RepID=A0A1Q2YC97_9ASCO|nr:hypothetical protein PMKS-000627 [Pichia membranifaciens]